MAKLKILHITTYQGGGAGIAAMRLHKALLKCGYDSKFLFLDKGKKTATEFRYHKKIYLWELLMRILKKIGLPLNLEQKNDYAIRKHKYNIEIFSFANTPYTLLHQHPLIKEADVIHFHWVANFVDYRTFFGNIDKPVVWTLHDMNPFQSGFHYKEDESRVGKYLQDLSAEQIKIKKEALQKTASNMLTIVAPSEWLLRLSKASELLGRFPHYLIPNGVDTNIFTVIKNDKQQQEKQKINVLFVAESLHNYRKGFDIVLEMLQDKTLMKTCRFTAVGEVRKSAQIPEISYIGIIKTEHQMSELYNAADIFLLPSREDNLPNSMVESLCCGTPVVGFAIGGLPETITDGKNGFLSDDLSATGLRKALLSGIANIDKFDRRSIAEDAHRKFSTEAQVKGFEVVYKSCLHKQLQNAIT